MSAANSMPRLGLSTNADLIDGDLGRFREELGLVAAAGAECAEIIFHSLDLVVNGRLDSRRLKAVKELTSAFDLEYSLHLPFVLNLLDREKGEMYAEVFRSGLEFASEIGCAVVVYHASAALLTADSIAAHYKARYGSEEPERLAELLFCEDAEALAGLADRAASLGVSIGVENPIRYDLSGIASYGFRPAELAAQLRRIARPNLGLTLDFGHLFLASRILGYDYEEAVATLAPLAIHAHLHDNFGKPDAGEPYIQRLPYGLGDLHLPPGDGLIPFDAVLPRLLAAEYRGILMLEIEFRFAREFPRHVDDFSARLASMTRSPRS